MSSGQPRRMVHGNVEDDFWCSLVADLLIGRYGFLYSLQSTALAGSTSVHSVKRLPFASAHKQVILITDKKFRSDNWAKRDRRRRREWGKRPAQLRSLSKGYSHRCSSRLSLSSLSLLVVVVRSDRSHESLPFRAANQSPNIFSPPTCSHRPLVTAVRRTDSLWPSLSALSFEFLRGLTRRQRQRSHE